MSGSPANRVPATPYTLELLRSVMSSLPPGEARVAGTILDHPFESLEWSAAELAEASATSPATVVRACRRLGFDGLQQFRVRLARDLGWSTDAPAVVEPSEPMAILEQLCAQAVTSFSDLPSTIDGQVFAAAVDCLAGARRVLLLSSGDTQPHCTDLAFRLTTGGRITDFPPDPVLQHVVARQLEPGDACLAVSNSGSNALTVRAAEAGLAAGATLVSVTGFARSRLGALADLNLAVGTFDFARTRSFSSIHSLLLVLALRALAAAVVSALGAPGEEGVARTLEVMTSYHYQPPLHGPVGR